MQIILEMADQEWHFGITSVCGRCDLVVFNISVWGHSVHCLKMPCNSKTPGHKAKHIEVCDAIG